MLVVVRGTGSIGMRHAAVLRSSERGVLLFPKRPERGRQLAEEGWACASSWLEAAGAGATHAVIATATRSHVEDILAALGAGLTVLVEKPVAASAAEAAPLAALGDEDKARIYCGMTMRYSDAFAHFKNCLGSVGSVHSAFVECRSWLPEWRPGSDYKKCYSASSGEGGVLRDLIHEIDYAGFALGWPLNVRADLVNTGRLGIAAEEQAFLHMEMPGGARVQVALDYLSRPPRRNFFVYGSAGTLHWDAISQRVDLSGELQEGSWHFPQSRDDMIRKEHDAFLDPSAGDAVGFDESMRALAVCDAAQRSSADSAWEAVENSGE